MPFKLNTGVLLFLLVFPVLHAQKIGSYQSYAYDVRAGLNSNYVKGVEADSEGRIWLVTDAGIMSFDGNNFAAYSKEFPGVYLKGILRTSRGKVYITSDDGVFEIVRSLKGEKFTKVVAGEFKVNENGLCFPKQLFEDKKGNIWISDLTGFVRYDGKYSRKFSFSKQYWPDSYFRSYAFVSTQSGVNFAASNNGTFFSYDAEHQTFDIMNVKGERPFTAIDAMIETSSGRILAGTDAGLFVVDVNLKEREVSYRQVWNLASVSSIKEYKPGQFAIGSWKGGIYLCSLSENLAISINEQFSSASVKHLSFAQSSGIWAATDRGILLLQEREIATYPQKALPSPYVFVASWGEKTMVTDGKIVFDIIGSTYDPVKVYQTDVSEIREIARRENFLWIVKRNADLIKFDLTSKKIVFNLNTPDDRVHSSFVATDATFWGYLPQSSRIIAISKSDEQRYIDAPPSLISYINDFEEYEGEIYAAGYGGVASILKFDKTTGSFTPAEFLHILPDSLVKSLRVNHLTFSGKSAYLTTPRAVIVVDLAARSYQVYDQFPQVGLLRCTLPIDDNTFSVGSDGGIYIVKKPFALMLQESDGLKSAAVLPSGLLLASKGNVLAATSDGFSLIDIERIQNRFTPAPHLQSILFFNRQVNEDLEPVSGINASVKLASYIFPGKSIYYQYRLQGLDTVWKTTGSEYHFTMLDLPAGTYTLELRAVAGGFFPSQITSYSFTVPPKWYSSIFVVILFWVSVILFLRYAVYYFVRYRTEVLENKRKELEQIINNRTLALAEEKERAEKLLHISEKANRELEQLSEQKSLLMSVAAHDLKNPLQSVLGFAELITDESNDEEIKQSAVFINNAAKKMLSQIHSLLESMASGTANHVVSMTNFNVSAVVQDVLTLLGHRASVKKQTIVDTIDPDAELFGDKELIAHMFDNLISNAVKYSPYGSTIKVKGFTQDSELIIKVSDEGPGFTDEDLTMAFRRFQRLSAKPTGGESSTGLGLSIIKYIVEQHKGVVTIENHETKGATITVRIPVNIIR